MNQTKYMMSGGLAFSENKDMEKLRRYSMKGWHVKGFKFMGYELEKGEGLEYIYCLDYRLLNGDEKEEYYNLFTSAGWSHVATEGHIHLFRAYPGTKPIYTDDNTEIEKYKNTSDIMKNLAIPSVLITALAWSGTMLSSGILKTSLLVLAVILSGITIPAVWTAIRAYNNKKRVSQGKGLTKPGLTMLYLLLIIAVITILVVGDPVITIKVLISALIGGIALPTAIWVIMSVYTNWGQKSSK